MQWIKYLSLHSIVFFAASLDYIGNESVKLNKHNADEYKGTLMKVLNN